MPYTMPAIGKCLGEAFLHTQHSQRPIAGLRHCPFPLG
nr:MAG TPA_asm: hypothetical protein [Caudoviricetes sp.]